MSVAVCSLGCDRKKNDIHSWGMLHTLDGDYSLYLNYELPNTTDTVIPRSIRQVTENYDLAGFDRYSLDSWSWGLSSGRVWRRMPKFDQDQARLASIVTARNMCIEYAMQTEASHLLFIDADIIPPLDIIPKLLETGKDAVAGLVHGRGAHSSVPYVFGFKHKIACDGYELTQAEHANIGYTMISRKLFEAVRFRWGTSHYPDGRVSMTSDDPAFHLDCFLKFGDWMYVRTDVLGQHVGDLKNEHAAQF